TEASRTSPNGRYCLDCVSQLAVGETAAGPTRIEGSRTSLEPLTKRPTCFQPLVRTTSNGYTCHCEDYSKAVACRAPTIVSHPRRAAPAAECSTPEANATTTHNKISRRISAE